MGRVTRGFEVLSQRFEPSIARATLRPLRGARFEYPHSRVVGVAAGPPCPPRRSGAWSLVPRPSRLIMRRYEFSRETLARRRFGHPARGHCPNPVSDDIRRGAVAASSAASRNGESAGARVASGETNSASVGQYASHWKQVWQLSCRAITGIPSGPRSNTRVGHTSTQRSHAMHRSWSTTSIMRSAVRTRGETRCRRDHR
jgi:hypothetical protein